MYPLHADKPWARAQWYVAGFSSEFGETPFERTILGDRILLYRTEAGEPVALGGLCPHRFMPLVAGRRVGDAVECPYHGMTFDAAGTCLIGPAASRAAGAVRLRHYPTCERGPLVWVWTGDPESPDHTLLPDGKKCGLEGGGWRADPNGVMHFAARYMLMVDNLFDLTHISWVHESLLGKPTICAQTPALTDEDGVLLAYERREVGPIDPFTAMLFPESVGPIQNLLGTWMLSPGLISAIGPSVSEVTPSPIAGKHWGTIHFVHAITPETERSTNIFSIVTRNFSLEDERLSAILSQQNKAVLAQDRDIAQLLEEGLDGANTQAERSFRSDRGGVEARRLIQTMVRRESIGDNAVSVEGETSEINASEREGVIVTKDISNRPAYT